MTTLSLEASKKVYEIVGEYETEKCWVQGSVEFDCDGSPEITLGEEWSLYEGRPGKFDLSTSDIGYGIPTPEWSRILDERLKTLKVFPTYNFAELVRVLPKIAKAKGWADYECPLFFQDIGALYMSGKTEPEGMAAVETYLMELL